jgi:hypothetical protein
MAIEYKVKVGDSEVTIRKLIDSKADDQEGFEEGGIACSSSDDTNGGGGANPKGGSGAGGGANPKGGSGAGGGANPKGGSGAGGGANPKGGSGAGGAGNTCAGSGLGTKAATMAFQMEKQEESEWCWAAVSASIDHHFDSSSTSTQCEIASEVINAPDCCTHKSQYNEPEQLQDALNVVHRLRKVTGRLAFDQLQAEIDAGRPVGVMILWDGGDGAAHFVVVSGYCVLASGVRTIDVADPYYPDSTDDFDLFPSAYHGGGTWTASYLTKPNSK